MRHIIKTYDKFTNQHRPYKEHDRVKEFPSPQLAQARANQLNESGRALGFSFYVVTTSID